MTQLCLRNTILSSYINIKLQVTNESAPMCAVKKQVTKLCPRSCAVAFWINPPLFQVLANSWTHGPLHFLHREMLCNFFYRIPSKRVPDILADIGKSFLMSRFSLHHDQLILLSESYVRLGWLALSIIFLLRFIIGDYLEHQLTLMGSKIFGTRSMCSLGNT